MNTIVEITWNADTGQITWLRIISQDGNLTYEQEDAREYLADQIGSFISWSRRSEFGVYFHEMGRLISSCVQAGFEVRVQGDKDDAME